MTTVLVRHQVVDYDVWKREYDRIMSGPLGAAVLAHQVWRGQDDPNLVVVAETYESRADADAAAAHPDLLAASMETLGVPFDLAITAREAGSYKPAPGHWSTFRERAGEREKGHDRCEKYHVLPGVHIGPKLGRIGL